MAALRPDLPGLFPNHPPPDCPYCGHVALPGHLLVCAHRPKLEPVAVTPKETPPDD